MTIVEVAATVFPPLRPAYALRSAEGVMQVDELLRKTVVFVGIENNGVFVPHGTGFFCRYEREGIGTTFVATAAHVFDGIAGNNVYFRVNRMGGGCSTISAPKDRAVFRPKNASDDVVMFGVRVDPATFDYLTLTLIRQELEEAKKETWEPHIGDEICVSGLYTSHYGELRNIPIVRIGHLAAMPEEKVRTGSGYVDGYLIELHSIAGLSGSPVFVTPPLIRSDGEGQPFRVRRSLMHVPIGVLIGHHVIETKEDEIVVPEFREDSIREPGALTQKNTGFGVVIPMERLFEMVETKRFEDSFADALAQHRARAGFKADGAATTVAVSAPAPGPPATEDNPTHAEDFRRLVTAAAKTRTPDA
jgi:hypothetical protein